MKNLPRKLTSAGAGIAGILAVLKFESTEFSLVAIICITLLAIVNMSLQAHADWTGNGKGVIDGKVQEKVKEILHPSSN